ncbi:MAG: thiolase domain-containing protein [Promethearchaeota archaeon]
MTKVAVVGAGMTKFGRLKDKDLLDLLAEASWAAIKDAHAEEVNFDNIFVGNMASGRLNNQSAVASSLADRLNIIPAGADRIENGPASGGSALAMGYRAILSGLSDVVLVVGGEKMTHVAGPIVTETVSTMTHYTAEKRHGVTLPSFAAMLTRLYSQRFGLTDAQRLLVAVKNHSNGALNPYAHFQKAITIEKAMKSPMIASPLRLYDCCPVSDGAAAIILVNAEKAESFSNIPVYILGSGQATDLHVVHERDDPLKLNAVKLSSEIAFQQAQLSPNDIDVVELHDAFSILEFVQSEQIGFFKPGDYIHALEEGKVNLDGDLPVNPSGGLKARGHPWGATGTAQACEIVWQLQNKAEKRQTNDPNNGFTCNFGGFGNNVVCHVFSKDLQP